MCGLREYEYILKRNRSLTLCRARVPQSITRRFSLIIHFKVVVHRVGFFKTIKARRYTSLSVSPGGLRPHVRLGGPTVPSGRRRDEPQSQAAVARREERASEVRHVNNNNSNNNNKKRE